MTTISSLWLNRVNGISQFITNAETTSLVNNSSLFSAPAVAEEDAYQQISNLQTSATSIAPQEEVETVSQEIFKAAQQTPNVSQTDNIILRNVKAAENTNVLKIYSQNPNFSTDTVRTVVTNKAGLNINLSDTAKSAISSLNTNALNYEVVAKAQDGKIVLPAEISGKADIKEVFSYENNIALWNTDNLNKDKKGKNFFVMNSPKQKKNHEENAALNLVA